MNNDIKHLVLGGGGPVGFVEYGILKHLSQNNFLKYENVKSIYATSVGGFTALFYILNIEWKWIDDYLIKRPFHKLCSFTHNDLLNIYFSKGFLTEEILIEIIKPLLLTKNLSQDITLKEFYEVTNISLYLFTVCLNDMKKIMLSHYSHPNLKLYEALYMSISIPILFKPKFYENNFYIDGGILNNNPIDDCINNEKCNINEILLLKNDKNNPIDLSNNLYNNLYNNKKNEDSMVNEDSKVNEDSDFFTFIIFMLKSLFCNFSINEKNLNIKNSINVSLTQDTVNISYWNYVFNNSNEREYLINLGVKLGNDFIEKSKNSNILIDNSNILIDNSNILIDNSNIILYSSI
jgi:predicted acylesterase/phospholipase RssA